MCIMLLERKLYGRNQVNLSTQSDKLFEELRKEIAMQQQNKNRNQLEISEEKFDGILFTFTQYSNSRGP